MGSLPYLKPDRLSDVLAAIQSMAMSERSSLDCRQWAEVISGDVTKDTYWRLVFREHTELFRESPDNEDHFALIWRRALPRRFYRPERRLLSQEEYDLLSCDQRQWVSRPPVPEDQLKTLIDIAVTLHARQQEQGKSWVPLVANLPSVIVGALLTIGGSYLMWKVSGR